LDRQICFCWCWQYYSKLIIFSSVLFSWACIK